MPHDQPLTETVTISADENGRVASCRNGPQRIVVGMCHDGEWSRPYLVRDGASLREALPHVNPRDVLDLLAAGRCGEFAVEVRSTRPAARRDIDFQGAF